MPSNVPLLEEAAAKLKHLLPEVIFVGGAVLDLLVTDKGSAPIRSTFDVDVVIAAAYAEYTVFTDRLRDIGFVDDTSPGAPLCRFLHGSLTLDVMSSQRGALGFSNRWYEGAIETAETAMLPSGREIRVIASPFFLGTKMEAFYGRGRGDYSESHDLEDFIAVIEGRDSLVREVERSPLELRDYLAATTSKLLDDERFMDALPGYVPGDAVSQQRVKVIVERLRRLSGR